MEDAFYAKEAFLEFSQTINQDDLSQFFAMKNSRSFSRELDKRLGFKISQIERKLLKKYRAFDKTIDDSNKKKHFLGTETWIGLHPQVLQTPYSEITHFFSYLKGREINRVVDFGAAYGRIGVVLAALHPEAEFLGFEILESRFNEAKRVFSSLELENLSMSNQNILEESFEIPKADIYFIYDFSDPHDLRVILKKLSAKLFEDNFFLVAKGEGIRSLIQLKYPEFWSCNGVIHEEKWSLYSSVEDLAQLKKEVLCE